MTICATSDWHLGDEHSNIPKILDLLDIIMKDDDITEVILCGDIYDLWLMKYGNIISREPFKTVHQKLIQVSEKKSVIYILGNHDFDIDYSWKVKTIELASCCIRNNIYFTHGNQYDEEQQKASIFYRLIAAVFPSIYQRFIKTPAQLINNPIEYLDRCKSYHDALRKVIKENDLDYLVCGHSHNPLIDGKLVDCGDFVRNCSYVIIKDGKPTLIDL
jgi:UDP-2,3-diacylglucosamine pyrophosphatase LpxH